MEESGVDIDLFGNYQLLEVALSLIGFPEDNTQEFDFDLLNGQPANGMRPDFDNMFCREWLTSEFHERASNPLLKISPEDLPQVVASYTDWLYAEYEESNQGISRRTSF